MEKMLGEIKRLLNDTQMLQFYEKQLMQATGEHFNVFEILRIRSREVTTHSPMLAELLDPKGRHGMGHLFLDIFTKLPFAKKVPLGLEVDSATRVKQEYPVGPKCEDSGGRIDILITDKNNTEVVIENKIYAIDQDKQITGYLKARPQAKVLYLTLDRHKPIEKVPPEDTERFACISYKTDVIQWLEACRKEAAHAPLVRETITQYINLIKVLTGQNINSRMNEQITKSILHDKDSLEAFFTLLGSKEHVINELLKKLEAQCKEIGAEFKLQLDFDPDVSAAHCGFAFSDDEMKQRNLEIRFQFEQNNFRSLNFGIARKVEEAEKKATRTPITDGCDRIFGKCTYGSWWPAEKRWQGREDWWTDGTFQDIFTGVFEKELREKVAQLAKILLQTKV